MFRLSKIADYGIVILVHMAQRGPDTAAGEHRSFTARELSEETELPQPVVSKALKTLTRGGVLESQRGSKGGYSLAAPPEALSVVDMVTAIDGPLALTQCSLGPTHCDLEESCAVKTPWQVINRVVHNALASVTLADLTNPAFATQHAPLAGLAGLAGTTNLSALRPGHPGTRADNIELTDPAVLEVPYEVE